MRHPSTRSGLGSGHPIDDLVARFRREVVSRGTFGKAWFLRHPPRWEPILAALEGRQARLLEIGSYEGLSSCYLLWRLPDAHLTCVDTFAGSPEHRAAELDLAGLEARFDANVALVDETRVRKLPGDSRRVLLDIQASEQTFDLVYVDGSHEALDVIVDAALAWPLLVPGGAMIFDDYRWDMFSDPMRRPGPAVDAFVTLLGEEATTLFSGRQLALRKREPALPEV